MKTTSKLPPDAVLRFLETATDEEIEALYRDEAIDPAIAAEVSGALLQAAVRAQYPRRVFPNNNLTPSFDWLRTYWSRTGMIPLFGVGLAAVVVAASVLLWLQIRRPQPINLGHSTPTLGAKPIKPQTREKQQAVVPDQRDGTESVVTKNGDFHIHFTLGQKGQGKDTIDLSAVVHDAMITSHKRFIANLNRGSDLPGILLIDSTGSMADPGVVATMDFNPAEVSLKDGRFGFRPVFAATGLRLDAALIFHDREQRQTSLLGTSLVRVAFSQGLLSRGVQGVDVFPYINRSDRVDWFSEPTLLTQGFGTEGYGDDNALILRRIETPGSRPELMTVSMVGLSLAGLGFLARRKR